MQVHLEEKRGQTINWQSTNRTPVYIYKDSRATAPAKAAALIPTPQRTAELLVLEELPDPEVPRPLVLDSAVSFLPAQTKSLPLITPLL
jgi:hypothetical protein